MLDEPRPQQATPDVAVLAFDHGQKRIGVAIGQTLTATASPLQILTARDGKPNWDEVQQLVRQWQAECLVVGLPLREDGESQENTHLARRFGNQLAGRTGLVVHWVDERFTSRSAEQRRRELRRAGAIGRNSSRHDDAVAAQLILEHWLTQDTRASTAG